MPVMPPTIELPAVEDCQEIVNLATGEVFIALPLATADLLRDLALRCNPCEPACSAPSCKLARATIGTFSSPLAHGPCRCDLRATDGQHTRTCPARFEPSGACSDRRDALPPCHHEEEPSTPRPGRNLLLWLYVALLALWILFVIVTCYR